MQRPPEPGTSLGDRYRLIAPLARGGMGSVWRAEHLALGNEVAVKIIDPRVASGSMGVPRFLREARALAALRSPYIVQVLDSGTQGEMVYLVMELLEGRTLRQRLRAEGKMSAGATSRLMRQVCRAMSHAHERGIVHRDLKPDNVFLCDATREHVTKVLDFGIAKPIGGLDSSDTGTEAGAFLGTPSYMSPEQCLGSKDIDHRSDLWSLGAIAYECLVGTRLYEGEVLGQLVVRICTEPLPVAAASSVLPAGFEVWLQRAMAKHPADRFQSAAELGESLARLLASSEEPTAGVDSAETLGDELAARQRARVEGVGSTLEHGLLAPLTGQHEARKPRSVLLAAGAITVVIVLGLVALLGIDQPSQLVGAVEAPQIEPARSIEASAGPAVATASNVPAPSTRVSSPLATASGQHSAVAADAGEASDARKPLPLKPRQRPLEHPAPVQSSQPAVSPPAALPVEELRRKR